MEFLTLFTFLVLGLTAFLILIGMVGYVLWSIAEKCGPVWMLIVLVVVFSLTMTTLSLYAPRAIIAEGEAETCLLYR
jgi:hypothetical protein